jgi:hypothetical protein
MSALKPCPHDPKCTACAVRDARREARLEMLRDMEVELRSRGYGEANIRNIFAYMTRLEAAEKEGA